MSEKSAVRCETLRCIDDIAKYGPQYHAVYDRAEGQCCERCGGKFNGTAWRHTCKHCKTEVQPGELVGLFVPHSCEACHEKVIADQVKRGAVCGGCKRAFALCCC
jgi:hypothetical protein